MKIAMSGSTGFIGRHLSEAFRKGDTEVIPLVRADFGPDEFMLADKMEGAEAVINLAGAPVAGRWTAAYKKTLYSSRIDTTKKIVAAFRRMKRKPAVFISASAIGIYSSEGVHDEDDTDYSSGFLGRLATDWERSALEAKESGIRTVILRFGVVLGRGGGALAAMLPPFSLGLGGVVGTGRQPFSWIHMKDLERIVMTAKEEDYEGIYNATAPNPVTNEEFTKTLGAVLNRPALLYIPSFLLKLRYGEGAQVLLDGQRVVPKRLLDSGFRFLYPDLESALKDLTDEKELRQ